MNCSLQLLTRGTVKRCRCRRHSLETTVQSSPSTTSLSSSSAGFFNETRGEELLRSSALTPGAHGEYRVDTSIRVVTRSQPPPPSALMRRAHEIGTLLPGPHADGAGWLTKAVSLHLRTPRQHVELRCQVSLLRWCEVVGTVQGPLHAHVPVLSTDTPSCLMTVRSCRSSIAPTRIPNPTVAHDPLPPAAGTCRYE